MQGWPAHRPFCQKEVLNIAKQHGLDAEVVKDALKVSVNGRLIFERAGSISGEAKGGRGFEAFCPSHQTAQTIQTSHDVGGQKTAKLPKAKSGRPPAIYVLPSVQELCDLLGVTNKGSDTLQLTDLGRIKAYRKAMLRELIRRHPRRYSRRFLTGLLGYKDGKDRRSVKRIIKELKEECGLFVVPKFDRQPITHTNLNLVPDGDSESDKGKWLEDAQGNRYAPRQWRAKRMLKERQEFYLVRQLSSFYTFNRELALKERQDSPPKWENPTYPTRATPKVPVTASSVETRAEHQPDLGIEMPPKSDTSPERQMKFGDILPDIKTEAARSSWSNLNPFSKPSKSRGKRR